MIYILLPCYNEYENLLILIDKINNIITKKRYRVKLIIVNDGSTDQTESKISKIKKKSKGQIYYVKHKKNLGLNMSLFTGFKKFLEISKKEDIVITLDSDNTHPISLIPNIVELLRKKKCDIVIASRFQKNSKIRGLSLFRKTLSEGARFIYKLSFSIPNVEDYTCNFRGYSFYTLKKSNLIKKNFFIGKDFSVVADLLINISSKISDLKIIEVPLNLRYDFKIGESKLKITTNIFKTILVIIRNLIN